MDSWYLDNLVCPIEKTPLSLGENVLKSDRGRRYPIVDGVPVMLIEEAEQTIGVARSSIARAHDPNAADSRANHLYLESLGIRRAKKKELIELAQSRDQRIDPVVAFMVGATSGYSYKHLIGRLKEYPIPELRLSASDGGTLLDVGCNWGRWSIAAARKGYRVVGIDPSLGGVMAARRVAEQLGLSIKYVVGDARFLPFRDDQFDTVFSYSVFQHLSKTNARIALAEVGRVLSPCGTSLIQMPNWIGIRSLYHQTRRRFREPKKFEVRYWSLRELKEVFEACVGSSRITADCYFGLGLQASDRHLMPKPLRLVIDLSEKLRRASNRIPGLTYFADSVYVESTKCE